MPAKMSNSPEINENGFLESLSEEQKQSYYLMKQNTLLKQPNNSSVESAPALSQYTSHAKKKSASDEMIISDKEPSSADEQEVIPEKQKPTKKNVEKPQKKKSKDGKKPANEEAKKPKKSAYKKAIKKDLAKEVQKQALLFDSHLQDELFATLDSTNMNSEATQASSSSTETSSSSEIQIATKQDWNNDFAQKVAAEVVKQVESRYNFAGSNMVNKDINTILDSVQRLRPIVSVKDFNSKNRNSFHIELVNKLIEAFIAYIKVTAQFPSRLDIERIAADLCERTRTAYHKSFKPKSSNKPINKKKKKRRIVESSDEDVSSEEEQLDQSD